MFSRVDKKLNLQEIEPRILAFWERERIFARLVEKNRGGPHYSFFDGPITANNPMGVHHAWGRTYKDIFQRYKAMRGFHQRYQNGFDCQGLWVEVGVEKALNLNSKRDILIYGLDKFSRACREQVEKYAALQTQHSIRLGQWMDWPNSYYTHTDTNIAYIWHFLSVCRAKGWLYKGHRSMPWCIRCGTSLSQHELIDSYKETTHRSVTVKLPVKGQPTHFFLVWTTTAWTLAANVALAVQPELDYLFVRQGEETFILSKGTASILGKGGEVVRTVSGKDLVGWTYTGPFDEFEVQKGAPRRVIPWEAVGEAEGTGIVHIAPGCGAEDFELSKTNNLPVLVPIDENGVYGPGYGFLSGENVAAVAPRIFESLKGKGLLYKLQDVRHRYPVCWRCHEELVFRVVDEWFIRCDEIREPMKRAAAAVTWIPDHIGKRMEDWLTTMGDWCISRKRFWGLPLPFYPCACGHMTVLGSREELVKRAVDRKLAESLPELHRPWVDAVKIACEKCGNPTARLPEVGDCWLDAGIIPFSTLEYLKDPGRKVWAEWFPAEFVCEMREQVRLWFYSTLFMAVTLDKENRAPYQTVLAYEKVLDEKGRPMHKSAGNTIWFDEAAEKMGADGMRWLYAGANIETNLRFGFGPAAEVRRKLLTLWNVYAFFVEYANIDKPDLSGDLAPKTPGLAELDRWILARLARFVALATRQYEAYLTAPLTVEAEKFFDDLSNWYLRRSRARFWKGGNDADKTAAYKTLHHVLLTTAKLLAPILPFTMEEMYQNLRTAYVGLPESVHLCPFPEPSDVWEDTELLTEMEIVQTVVGLGHAIRATEKMRVRQPLAVCRIAAPDMQTAEKIFRHEQLIQEELNVKEVKSAPDQRNLFQYKVKPNFARLGPRLGKRVGDLAKILETASPNTYLTALRTTGWSVPGWPEPFVLQKEDVTIQTVQTAKIPAAEGNGLVVILDTKLTPALVAEGRAREVVHHVQALRKARDLPYEARIRLWIAGDNEVVEACRTHATTIQEECLAAEVLWAASPSGGEAADVDGKAVRLDLQLFSRES